MTTWMSIYKHLLFKRYLKLYIKLAWCKYVLPNSCKYTSFALQWRIKALNEVLFCNTLKTQIDYMNENLAWQRNRYCKFWCNSGTQNWSNPLLNPDLAYKFPTGLTAHWTQILNWPSWPAKNEKLKGCKNNWICVNRPPKQKNQLPRQY